MGSGTTRAGPPRGKPETVATAIRIGNPASWKFAEAARDDSHGWIDRVTDEQILDAQAILAAEAGVFIEPGSAASIARSPQGSRSRQGPRRSHDRLHGYGQRAQDTATALSGRELDFNPIAPTLEAARRCVRALMRIVHDRARVAVPATSGNLGPGFDCMGMAHDLWDEVEARVAPTSQAVEPWARIDIQGRGRGLPASGQFPPRGAGFAPRADLPVLPSPTSI